MQKGDVIQISPESECHSDLRGKLAFVTEVKSFGCIAGVEQEHGTCPVRVEPLESGKFAIVAYVRLLREDFEPIGRAEWVPPWVH